MSSNRTGDFADERHGISSRLKQLNLSTIAVKWGPLLTLILLCIVISILSPSFLSARNFRAVAKQASMLLIVAMGPTFVIVMGCIDLSIEGLMAVGSVFVGILVLNDRTNMDLGLLGIFIAVAICTFLGFLNGFIHAKGRIPSFMVTLGMLFIGIGLGTWVFGGYPIRIHDELLVKTLGRGVSWGIPNLAFVAAVLFLICLFIERHTRVGRYAFAIGGGEDLARLSGVPVDRYKIIIFTLDGCLLGIAGVLIAGRLGVAAAEVGDFLFPAITSIVVGGTALTGGVGGVLQTLVGALIVAIITSGMILLDVHPYVQLTVQGIIVTGAVILTLDRAKIPIIK